MADAASKAVAKARSGKKTDNGGTGGANVATAPGVVDPMQWWGALTQQFQEIAAGAIRETAVNPMQAATHKGAGTTKATKPTKVLQAAKPSTRKATSKSRPRGR